MRFGILGAAKIADKYTVDAMHATAGVEPVSVAARDAYRAKQFAERHGLHVVSSYEALVQSEDIDAVYIPLPNALHVQWALEALRAGKHVLVEKSLAGSLEGAAEVIASARRRDLLVVENFMCEHHEQNLTVRREVDGGGIGELRQTSLAFGFPPFPEHDQRNSAELAGGALNDAGAYCLDMAAFFHRAMPRRVFATTASLRSEVDQTGSAQLIFADGSVSQSTWGFAFDYRNEVRLWGSAGQITTDRAFSIPPERVPSVEWTANTVRTAIAVEPMNHFEGALTDFVSRVEEGRHSDLLDRLEGHAVVMDAARRSAASAQVVDLEQEWSQSDLARFDRARSL